MINLDDRFITELMPEIKPNGVAVLLAIAKHCNVKKKAFPSNERLCNLTGLSINTVKKTLRMLQAKGLIKTDARSENGKTKSNEHTVNTGYISIYITAKQLPFSGTDRGSNSDGIGGQNLTDRGSNSDGIGGQNLTDRGSNSDPEVLAIGSINNKEVLTRRRRKRAPTPSENNFSKKKSIVQDLKKNDAPPLVPASPPHFEEMLKKDCAWINKVSSIKKIDRAVLLKMHTEFHQYKKLVNKLNHKDYSDYLENFLSWLDKKLEKQGRDRQKRTNSKIIKTSKYDKYRKKSQ